MSDSDILLDVSVADESSEVIVVDSGFRVLARGIHAVQLKVPPGIYRAKVRVGDQQSEKLFSVEPNEPGKHKIVQLAPLEFSSPIPLAQTSTSREFHQGAMCHAAVAGGVTARLGQGAALVIFLRDPSLAYFDLAAEQMASYGKNFEGFLLGKLDAGEPHPLETIGTLVADRGYLIASVAVDPGTYALSRVSSGTERLCLPLVVPAGWSLQVFVSMVPTDESGVGRRADFDGTAMVFDRPDAGFFPDRPDLRVLEVARQALARGHNVIDANTMAVLLSGKFENPMMGLLAVHLLLLAKKPDLELAQKVVTNTGKLIGADYPDILVLSWKLGQLRGTADAPDAKALVERVKGPPMLQLSWHYFMEAYRSLADKEVLDKGISRMASQLVSSSVWVSWLDSAAYPSVPANVVEITTPDGAQEKLGSAPPDAIGYPASGASQVGGAVTPAPAEISSRALAASEKTMGTPSFGLGGITKAIGRSASLVRGKVADWFETKTGVKHLELPTLQSFKVELPELAEAHLETALEKARIGMLRKLQSVEVDTSARVFETLVERVDWKSVVGQLKSATRAGAEPRPLTPLQRQLLLSLKAAREQFEDEGKLPEDAVGRRLNIPDVPMHAILGDLNLLAFMATSLDKPRPSSLTDQPLVALPAKGSEGQGSQG